MVRVAVIDDFHRAFTTRPSVQELSKRVELTIYEEPFASPEAQAAALAGVEIVIANRERTKFTAELLARLPDLKLISNTGSHFYHVDLDAAAARGLLLANAPGGSSPSVVELTIAMLIALVRRLPQNDAAVRAGQWPIELFGSVQYKTLGVLGMGKIGTGVARVANALEMQVLAWGPTLDDARATRSGAIRRELDDLMRKSDFVSVHLPLTSLSRGLVSRERIDMMKPTAYLINTARAAVTDEAALVDALRTHQIAGAALDVFLEEPLPPDSPFRTLDNVLLSPHAGWTTHEAYGPWIDMTVENVHAYLDGEPIRIHSIFAQAGH